MDFTSALYLGITHPFHSLASWEQLTTGRPDVLLTPQQNRYVGAELAKLSGCEEAILGPSTFHLFWDLFNILADDRIALYFDRCVYPITRWAAARAAERGIPVRWFPHHDPEALGRKMADGKIRGQRPVVVSDGFCPGCGKHAPIAAYMDIVEPRGGRLVIDDTQALGIWGRHPNPIHPYGRNGGGSLRRAGIGHRCIILVNSLAKAFGAPLAMIAGSKNVIQRFRAESQTRVHCSPPSTAAVAAAMHALAVNAVHGDALRRRLSQLVFFFKKQLARIPMARTSGIFPVQSLGCPSTDSLQMLYRKLQHFGVQAVLNRRCHDLKPQLSFLITIGHTSADILNIVKMLATITSGHGSGNKLRRLDDAL